MCTTPVHPISRPSAGYPLLALSSLPVPQQPRVSSTAAAHININLSHACGIQKRTLYTADFAMLDPDLRKRTRTKLAGREREREEMTSVLLVIGYDGFW